MITGASVKETIRTGSLPWALKCWCQVLSGVENRLPRLPLQSVLLAALVPDRRCPLALENKNRLFVHMALWL